MVTKIDGGMPNRISMNVSVAKQSQGATFGERVNVGLQQAGSAVASGAALVGGVIPGAGIVSAAVSSVTNPDQAVLVGVTLITATFVIVANLIVDILYAAIDPRVRLA